MAMIAEDILQLGYQGPPTGTPWDDQFAAGARIGRTPDNIAHQLDMWKQHMPVIFQVDKDSSTPPMPHFVINIVVSSLFIPSSSAVLPRDQDSLVCSLAATACILPCRLHRPPL